MRRYDIPNTFICGLYNISYTVHNNYVQCASINLLIIIEGRQVFDFSTFDVQVFINTRHEIISLTVVFDY